MGAEIFMKFLIAILLHAFSGKFWVPFCPIIGILCLISFALVSATSCIRVEEADRENQALMRRRELINDGTEPKNLRVRDGNLFIRLGTKWVKEKTPEVHGSF